MDKKRLWHLCHHVVLWCFLWWYGFVRTPAFYVIRLIDWLERLHVTYVWSSRQSTCNFSLVSYTEYMFCFCLSETLRLKLHFFSGLHVTIHSQHVYVAILNVKYCDELKSRIFNLFWYWVFRNTNKEMDCSYIEIHACG